MSSRKVLPFRLRRCAVRSLQGTLRDEVWFVVQNPEVDVETGLK